MDGPEIGGAEFAIEIARSHSLKPGHDIEFQLETAKLGSSIIRTMISFRFDNPIGEKIWKSQFNSMGR